MKVSFSVVMAAACLLAVCPDISQGGELVVTVTFAGSEFGGDAPPITSLLGWATFAFDPSVVTGSGYEEFLDIPLTGFGLSPNPLGAMTFSIASGNVAGGLWYESGVLSGVAVGGPLSGLVGLSPGTDDFLAFRANLETEPVSGLSYTTSATDQWFQSGVPVVTANVPDPATLSLLVLGGLGLVARRPKRTAGKLRQAQVKKVARDGSPD